MQSLRGSKSARHEFVLKAAYKVRLYDPSEALNASRRNVEDVCTSVGSQANGQMKLSPQYVCKKSHLFNAETVRLKSDSCIVGGAVVHEPDGHRQRRQITRYV